MKKALAMISGLMISLKINLYNFELYYLPLNHKLNRLDPKNIDQENCEKEGVAKDDHNNSIPDKSR